MPIQPGEPLNALDTPQLLIDLDVVDQNLRSMFTGLRRLGVKARVHFKSLKCTGLARYVAAAGADGFLCAKLNEAEALADAGLTDLFVANQIVGSIKLRRLANLAGRASVRVCVDNAENVRAISRTCQEAGVTMGVLAEVDVRQGRCGVEPGEPAVALAKLVFSSPGLQFLGLQGYQGHLQMVADLEERKRLCRGGLKALVATRKRIEDAGIPVEVVTSGGTGTWDMVGEFRGVTEVQPGSFVLMDAAYRRVRSEFGCALSILTTVVSRRPTWYVLDAGSKAISQDFGTPMLKDHPQARVAKLSEEHTKVETNDDGTQVGDRVEVIPTHCCATMNLHRSCIAVRQGRVEAVWPIEASGRYD